MSNPIDLSLYLVLDPFLTRNFGMVETAVAAVKAGATVVQLRAPDWKKREFYECALALKKALVGTGTQLIINDHVDVAIAIDADGVHIGQKDLPPEVTRAMIGPHKILGLSVSTQAELAGVNPTIVDYIGIGPVFATSTKKDAAPAMGLENFETIAKSSLIPNVAIGGIAAKDVGALVRAGANGVAVVSAICGQADPHLATWTLKLAWEKAQR